MARKNTKSSSSQDSLKFYPPVVVVLGHVDHGKTTLLDVIRRTDVAQKEHGGITQKIGASTIEIIHEGLKRKITFVDTPGHEAFVKMRSRGAQVADIGLLIVSSLDGIMPQTKESIKLLMEAKIPFIVVLTKADLPEKNPEKIKQQLLKEGVMLERLGGDIPVIEVSAKTNKNIKELLDLILLTLEIEGYPFVALNEKGLLKAIIVESKLDPKVGPKATVVIKNGKINLKDEISCEGIRGKVKAIITDKGEHVSNAVIGDAVEILGFEKVPPVGGIVNVWGHAQGLSSVGDSSAALASELFASDAASNIHSARSYKSSPFSIGENSVSSQRLVLEPTLSLILGADTQGSLEAIVNSLPKTVNIILQKTGDITQADIFLAKSVGAIVLSFNTKLKPEVISFAATEKVLLKNYAIIYELIDEIKDVLEGKKLALEEKIFGRAKILASFPFEKTKVLGVIVLEGRIAKGDKVRLVRGEETIGESSVSSLRKGKDQTSKVEKGQEAGVLLSPSLDFTIGDMLVCHG